MQGVGFRPFVWQFARLHELTGLIRNEGDRVILELQGPPSVIPEVESHLATRLPPLAAIARMAREEIAVIPGEADFQIQESRGGGSALAFAASDAAVCGDCLSELRNPLDRRHRYALTNCTQCGPRFSILLSLPYDRLRTTMAGFPMCSACQREYESPQSRRFHAQPNACPDCGPWLEWWNGKGRLISGDPVVNAVKTLMDGGIVAIKGIGGYHLAARARDGLAVDRLRSRKGRETKPFALMVPHESAALEIVDLSVAARAILRSSAAPIVLAPRTRRGSQGLAEGVAPGQHRLGVMLAYTPLHHLLFDAEAQLGPLVMTSGNLSDEPLCIDDGEARERLLATPGPPGSEREALADALLLHTRPIQRPVDDSVVLDLGEGEQGGVLPLRRSRGFAPGPVAQLRSGTMGLALGGDLKAAPAVVCDGRVVMGQHLGDLEGPLAFDRFQEAITDLCELYRVKPDFIAIDSHPRYHGSAFGRRLAESTGAKIIPVQHHHAHGASVLAEHGHTGPALAVICDGTGYGEDGTSWGGELLLIEGSRFKRLATLKPLRLPGGDASSKETRRCALAILHAVLGDAFDRHSLCALLYPDPAERAMACAMIRQNVSCVLSSGAGRYVDGVASLLGLASYNHHEALSGQALESRAALGGEQDWKPPPFPLLPGDPAILDLSPLLLPLIEASLSFPKAIGGGTAEVKLGSSRDADISIWAHRFHRGLAAAWEQTFLHFSRETGIRTAAVSGGVFSNGLLTRMLCEPLAQRGMTVLRHRNVPPNDGGLALGQAAVAIRLLDNSPPCS